jgi:23S rRNA (adenine2503-C2)-methyltransferase
VSAAALNLPDERPGLWGWDRARLEAWFVARGEPAYRARQVLSWLHRRGVENVDAMTDLGRASRAALAASFRTERLLPDAVVRSADGTEKAVFRLAGGAAVETVLIPEEGRTTLCVSSQAGCPIDCAFCATAAQGFQRNLEAHEIMAQVRWAIDRVGREGLTNVVFMGMGEPLANYRAVASVVRLLLDPVAYGLSRRRVTVSTSGLVPQMRRLADELDVALAVSLHAAHDALRDRLVPLNRVHPLAEVLAACRVYLARRPDRHVLVEYALLEGVNDGTEEARALARLLRGLAVKVNLIPFNPFPGSAFRRPSEERIAAFQGVLTRAGVFTRLRRTRGEDIAAACGQLAGEVRDRRKHAPGAEIPCSPDRAA